MNMCERREAYHFFVLERKKNIVCISLWNILPLVHWNHSRIWIDHMGWYLSHKYFAPGKADWVREQILDLVDSLRPMVLDLVDSFGIPESLVHAPIAGDWVKYYSYVSIIFTSLLCLRLFVCCWLCLFFARVRCIAFSLPFLLLLSLPLFIFIYFLYSSLCSSFFRLPLSTVFLGSM